MYYLQVAENPEDRETPLFTACEFGHLEVVKFLVENGANVNCRRITNSTPLYVSSSHGYSSSNAISNKSSHTLIVEYLIANGADQTLTMDGEVIPLYIACQDGQVDAAAVLIKNGSDINHPCDDTSTPLHAACQYGHLPVVQLLLRNYAHLSPKWGNRDAIDLAKKKDHKEILQALEQKIRDIRWSFVRWVWIGYMKENGNDCLLAAIPKELVNEIAFFVNKGVEIL
jgi:ankyrin repeat protein